MTSLKQLRDLNIREQAKANEEANNPPPSPDTSVDTDLRTYGSAEGRKPGSTYGLTEVRKEGSPEARTDALEETRQGIDRTNASVTQVDYGPDLLERVRIGLATKADIPGGVKSTADMSPELNRRARQYSLDHNNVSIRQMLLVLLDGFLKEEGY